MIRLHLAFNVIVLFCWILVIPAVLVSVFEHTPVRAGSAFASAVAGTVMDALRSAAIDQLSFRSVT